LKDAAACPSARSKPSAANYVAALLLPVAPSPGERAQRMNRSARLDPMRKQFCLVAVLGVIAATLSFEAQAFPISNLADQADHLLQIRQGCGLGRHRGPWGGCRWNKGGGCWWRSTPWGPRRVCRW